MALYIVLGLTIGGAVGYGWSRLVRCQGGSCPMTDTWPIAVLIGAGLGLYVALQFNSDRIVKAETGSMAQLIESEGDFEAKVLQADKPVLVDFYADWCSPCKFLAPVVEELAGEVGDKADVYKVDVDKLQSVAGKYQIQSIPTVIVFSNGEIASSFVGVRAKEDYLAAINEASGG